MIYASKKFVILRRRVAVVSKDARAVMQSVISSKRAVHSLKFTSPGHLDACSFASRTIWAGA